MDVYLPLLRLRVPVAQSELKPWTSSPKLHLTVSVPGKPELITACSTLPKCLEAGLALELPGGILVSCSDG